MNALNQFGGISLLLGNIFTTAVDGELKITAEPEIFNVEITFSANCEDYLRSNIAMTNCKTLSVKSYLLVYRHSLKPIEHAHKAVKANGVVDSAALLEQFFSKLESVYSLDPIILEQTSKHKP